MAKSSNLPYGNKPSLSPTREPFSTSYKYSSKSKISYIISRFSTINFRKLSFSNLSLIVANNGKFQFEDLSLSHHLHLYSYV